MRPDAGRNRRLRRGADRTENDRQRSVPKIAASLGRATDARHHIAKRFGQCGTIGAALSTGTDSQWTLLCLPQSRRAGRHPTSEIRDDLVLGESSAQPDRARTSCGNVSRYQRALQSHGQPGAGPMGKTGLEHSLQRIGVAGAAGYEALVTSTLTLNPQPVLTTDKLLADPRWKQLLRELMLKSLPPPAPWGLRFPLPYAEEQIERTRTMAAYRHPRFWISNWPAVGTGEHVSRTAAPGANDGRARARLAALCQVLPKVGLPR